MSLFIELYLDEDVDALIADLLKNFWQTTKATSFEA